jgi:hypothetical protein
MPRLAEAVLGLSLCAHGIAYAKTYSTDEVPSKDWRQALEVYKKNLVDVQAKRAEELKQRKAEIKTLEDQIADLEKREDKLKKEIEGDTGHASAGLQEALNVVDSTLFGRRFELEKLQRAYHEKTEPQVDAWDKEEIQIKIDISSAEVNLQGALVREKKAAKLEAERLLAKQRAKAAREAAAKKKKKAAAKVVQLGEAAPVVEKPPEPEPPGPKPWDPKPPPTLHCPAPPAVLDADTKPYFQQDWDSACWFEFSYVLNNIDYPAALRLSLAVAKRAVKPVTPPKLEPGAPPVVLPPEPDQKAADIFWEAEFACRAGPVPYLTYRFFTVSYDIYDKAGRGDLAEPVISDGFRRLGTGLARAFRIVQWTRAMYGCEAWAGNPTQDGPPAHLAQFDEWQVANKLSPDDLDKTMKKVETADARDPKLHLYDRIYRERQMGATSGAKPGEKPPAAPEKVPPKAAAPPPAPAAPPAIPAP